jgi:phenylalanyl-tRNA synthetase beta chain
MKAPLSWIKEFAELDNNLFPEQISQRLIQLGFEVEDTHVVGAGLEGPLVVGKVLEITELTEFKKPIRFCKVDIGGSINGIVCGATNFQIGNHVIVALPGAVLPGDFKISVRETYGYESNGMICSTKELGLGEDQSGILVIDETFQPGMDAFPLVNAGDVVFDLSVLPDRGYAMSIRGIARELASSYGVKFVDPATRDFNLPNSKGEPCQGEIVAPEACDVLVLRTLEGVDAAKIAPWEIRRKIILAGMRSISLAVDITNYIMLELGQPLHAFDRAKISGKIIVRTALPAENLTTLDHVQRKLKTSDLLICDEEKALSIAGVMGGLDSEVSFATSQLVIEAAHFNPSIIAGSSRSHVFSSEASRRFERGVDYKLPVAASKYAASLLLKHGGGTYAGEAILDNSPKPHRILMDVNMSSTILGFEITPKQIQDCLTSIGATVKGTKVLEVEVPSWRSDLTAEHDLIEEIVRILGYQNIPSTLPITPPARGLTHHQQLKRSVDRFLAARGLVEVLNYPFVSHSDLEDLLLDSNDDRTRLPRLANPISEEVPFLRGTLLTGLAGAARRNISRGSEDLALFETGLIYMLGKESPTVHVGTDRKPSPSEIDSLEQLLPAQPQKIGILLTGNRQPASWWSKPIAWDYLDAINIGKEICDLLHVSTQISSQAHNPWHPGRVAQFFLNGVVIGHAGELHPRVIDNLGLPKRSCALELDLTLLFSLAPEVTHGNPILSMPVAKEDLAIAVDISVPTSQIMRALKEGAGPLLESIALFDIYVGDQISTGKRSLAFAMKFRAADRTLTADETAQAKMNAFKAVESEFGATLR